jgi:hypothetical protein
MKSCGSGGIAPTFFTSALDGGEWSASRPCRFTPGARAPGTHWIGGWVGPRAGLDTAGQRKSCTAGYRTQAAQPVARHHTDWAIPTPPVIILQGKLKFILLNKTRIFSSNCWDISLTSSSALACKGSTMELLFYGLLSTSTGGLRLLADFNTKSVTKMQFCNS